MCIEIGGGWVWAWTDEMKQFLFAWRHFEAVWLWTLIVVFIITIIIALRCVLFGFVENQIRSQTVVYCDFIEYYQAFAKRFARIIILTRSLIVCTFLLAF